MEIKLKKEMVFQIDSARRELGVKQKIVLTREEMVEVLLQKGTETFKPQFSEKISAGVGTVRPGVLCFGADKSFTLIGALFEPDPEECVNLLNKEGALLMVIFGEAGCGVSTLIRDIQLPGIHDVDVFDEGNPDSVNIPEALGAFRDNRKVIVSMNARTIDEAERTLRRYADKAACQNQQSQ